MKRSLAGVHAGKVDGWYSWTDSKQESSGSSPSRGIRRKSGADRRGSQQGVRQESRGAASGGTEAVGDQVRAPSGTSKTKTKQNQSFANFSISITITLQQKILYYRA